MQWPIRWNYFVTSAVRIIRFFVCLALSYSYFAPGTAFGQSLELPKEVVASTLGAAEANPPEKTYSISIVVTNIRNHKGVIRFKFYDDVTGFPHATGFLKVVVPKTEMRGDSLLLTYHGFKSQNMGIALLDDENNNVKLDMGWFLPKEGHAFSDYYHSALRRPVYKDFDFFLTGDKVVRMKMKYY